MRWLPLAAAFVASSLLMLGCGHSTVDVTATREAPLLRDVQVTPDNLSFDFGGGTVNVSLSVESPRSLSVVNAELTPLDVTNPTVRVIPLIPAGANAFQASIQVPSNTSSSGQTVRYRLSLYAKDVSGASSASVDYEVRVSAPDSGGLPVTP